MAKSMLIYGMAACAALALAPVAASADGPCTGDIAQLSRQLGGMNGLGAPISEPSAGVGSKPSGTQAQSGTSGSSDTQNGANRGNGGSPGTVAGAGGPESMGSGARNPVVHGQVATSPEDVRRQSEGLPTTAQQAATGDNSNGTDSQAAEADKISEAKMALQRAVDLNAKGDSSCMAAIDETRKLMPKS